MQVRVWNDNTYPHTEEFKGEKVTIPARGHVMMEWSEAHEFKGRYTPIIRDGGNQPKPESFKMIRIESVSGDQAVAAAAGFPCQACGKSYESQRVLDTHIDEQHLDAMADQDVAQKRRGRPRKEA